MSKSKLNFYSDSLNNLKIEVAKKINVFAESIDKFQIGKLNPFLFENMILNINNKQFILKKICRISKSQDINELLIEPNDKKMTNHIFTYFERLATKYSFSLKKTKDKIIATALLWTTENKIKVITLIKELYEQKKSDLTHTWDKMNKNIKRDFLKKKEGLISENEFYFLQDKLNTNRKETLKKLETIFLLKKKNLK